MTNARVLNVLLVDDEPTIRLSVGDALRAANHDVVVVADGASALTQLDSRVFDLVVTDVRLPKMDGLNVLRAALAKGTGTDVILMTAYASVSDAVSALKLGAYDYLTKPFDTDELLLRVGRIAERRRLEAELSAARQALIGCREAKELIGESPAMVQLRQRLVTIAASDANVLISGESGTGKELVAHFLHERSPRATGPLLAVNCAAFPEGLLEAELFGHERGAFTGAIRKRHGRFAAADRGTLLLDEVAEMPLPAQAKLLRVLQEGEVEPLGSNRPVRVDVRVLAATHQDLRQCVADGRFREDLYYRLKVLDIIVPPLRERRGDLPLLVQHFLTRHGRPQARISPAAWAALTSYAFPGNVRELDHAIHHAVVLAAGSELALHHLPSEIAGDILADSGGWRPFPTLSEAVREFERQYLQKALARAGGKRSDAAEALGISRKNLWEKLKSHGITDLEPDA